MPPSASPFSIKNEKIDACRDLKQQVRCMMVSGKQNQRMTTTGCFLSFFSAAVGCGPLRIVNALRCLRSEELSARRRG